MTQDEQEIRDCYASMKQPLTCVSMFSEGKFFDALSQYGYCLEDGFTSVEDAEQFVIDHYAGENMKYIRQG
jgi:hypothetical protein